MIPGLLAPHAERAYGAMRVIFGLLFAIHGMQKLFGILGAQALPIASQMGIGGVIEFVGGLLIAFGLFSSWAAFLASGQMAVAYLQFHWKFQFSAAFFPVVNKGELAVLYCFAFLYIACRGPGAFSLDAYRSNAKVD
ncbi:DoxX family protein [Pendulispora rubella]|uniref:DoxX family protein n=1 Tax=Pendulispora rubella TaxID=2741070 RepID=A0ABZ2L1T0_9BACT